MPYYIPKSFNQALDNLVIDLEKLSTTSLGKDDHKVVKDLYEAASFLKAKLPEVVTSRNYYALTYRGFSAYMEFTKMIPLLDRKKNSFPICGKASFIAMVKLLSFIELLDTKKFDDKDNQLSDANNVLDYVYGNPIKNIEANDFVVREIEQFYLRIAYNFVDCREKLTELQPYQPVFSTIISQISLYITMLGGRKLSDYQKELIRNPKSIEFKYNQTLKLTQADVNKITEEVLKCKAELLRLIKVCQDELLAPPAPLSPLSPSIKKDEGDSPMAEEKKPLSPLTKRSSDEKTYTDTSYSDLMKKFSDCESKILSMKNALSHFVDDKPRGKVDLITYLSALAQTKSECSDENLSDLAEDVDKLNLPLSLCLSVGELSVDKRAALNAKNQKVFNEIESLHLYHSAFNEKLSLLMRDQYILVTYIKGLIENMEVSSCCALKRITFSDGQTKKVPYVFGCIHQMIKTFESKENTLTPKEIFEQIQEYLSGRKTSCYLRLFGQRMANHPQAKAILDRIPENYRTAPPQSSRDLHFKTT